MPSIGSPTVSFSQGDRWSDGVCCRLSYKWLAAQVAPGKIKHGGFFTSKLNKTLEKQNAYLKEAEPFEKEIGLTFRMEVNAITDRWLNIWGMKHGLKFDAIAGPKTCSEYFGNYEDRSAIIGIFGRTAGDAGNWAHATAYFTGNGTRKFFDANKGEWSSLTLPIQQVGQALDEFHQYLKNPGETLDRYSFFVLL
jgi:hypothetical protein